MKFTPERLKAWSDAFRDAFGTFSAPLLHLYLIGLGLVLWLGGWSRDTEAQRLNVFGIGWLMSHVVMAFGLFWLRRTRIDKARIQSGPFSAEIETDDARSD